MAGEVGSVEQGGRVEGKHDGREDRVRHREEDHQEQSCKISNLEYIEKILKSAFLLSLKVSIFLPLFDILQLCNQDRRWVRPQFLVREHPQRKQVEDGAADGHDAGDIPTQQKVARRQHDFHLKILDPTKSGWHEALNLPASPYLLLEHSLTSRLRM